MTNPPSSPLLIIVGHDGEAVPDRHEGFKAGGGSDLYKLLPEGLPFDQVNLAKRFFKQQDVVNLPRYPCILNLVTDADQHPQTLATLQGLLRGYRGRVINSPEAVRQSTREKVAERLAGIPGLKVPRVLRLPADDREQAVAAVLAAGLQFPLIVRQAGTHTGRTVSLVGDVEALPAALTGSADHIATEFVELRGGDGLYRKYRVYFFGRRVIYRNLYLSEHWSVHAKDHRKCLAARPALIRELQAMFARPEGAFPDPVLGMFAEVRARMPLDYFGMDFGFAPDGEAVLFEANASMSFVPHWPDVQFRHSVEPAMQALRAMLAEAITGPGGVIGLQQAR